MNTKTTLILVLLICAAAYTPAAAGLDGSNEASAQAGMMLFENGSDIETCWIYGGRFGRFFTEQLSGEVSMYAGRTRTETLGTPVGVQYASGYAVYHFPFGKFMPFLQVGAGLLMIKTESNKLSVNYPVHWGGGLKYLYSRDLVLRADFSHVINTRLGQNNNNLLTALGASWLFGGSDSE